MRRFRAMVNIHARNCLSSPRKFDRSRAATSQVSASMSSAAAGSNPRRNRSNRECISCQRTAIAQCAPSWAAASTSANSVVATSADDLRFELLADLSAHDVDHDVLDRSEWRMLTSSPLARLGAEYPDCPGHEMGQSGACKALWPDCVVGNACLRRRAGKVRGHRGRLRIARRRGVEGWRRGPTPFLGVGRSPSRTALQVSSTVFLRCQSRRSSSSRAINPTR